MKHTRILLSTFILLFQQAYAQTDYSRFVNPFIGTGGHGHTYPGAVVPHGMVQLSPDTRLDGWDGCSGYHYSDTFIYGFSHTHLSGTGCSDYGDILLMPGNGTPSPDNKKYGSTFSHQNEKASPGYYAVKLDKHGIDVELTATERVGFHHYRFSKPNGNYVLLDLKHRDEVLESSFTVEDSITVTGMRRSKAWAENQVVFFVMKFSRPISSYKAWQNDVIDPASKKNKFSAKNLKAFFSFKTLIDSQLLVQVAISPVSIDGAKRNLQAEAASRSFQQIKKQATDKWNRELAKIEVTTDQIDKKTIFYTSLYHTAIVPNINMDVDGQYRGRDGQIHHAEGFTYYSVFSLWDTYRAAHPLYTIIDQKRTLDYIKTFLVQYQQGGRLPVWELSSNETDCMIGYHSIPVIVDAYMKGIRGFDVELALEAMLHSATADRLGIPAIQSKKCIEVEDDHESVSKTLEYAYDDYCIAIFAKALGKMNVYEKYIRRAQAYKNLFDPQNGFMRPVKNGGWMSPFDPREVNNHYTEANSWQYSFYVPQDVDGWIKLLGGKEKLEEKLDALFQANSQTTGREQSDITGLIGQYAHGNEPSHHIAWLYNYTDHPEKAQFYVNRILKEFYTNAPDGLIGNEDCGQMSAWYVMSSMGIYPVTPGTDIYQLGSPFFTKIIIHLENGKICMLENRDKQTEDDMYLSWVKKMTSGNQKPDSLTQPQISHASVMKGLSIFFQKTVQPNKVFGVPSIQTMEAAEIVVNPRIAGGGLSFDGVKEITIFSTQPGVDIYFTTDGTDPDLHANLYRQPLRIDSTVMIKAVAINKAGEKSGITTARFRRLKNHYQVIQQSPFMKSYDGGGANAMVDEIFGNENWRMGGWQGYQGLNPEFTIDLLQSKPINKIKIGFLQDTRSWIVMPASLVVAVSEDGKKYREVFRKNDFLPANDFDVQIKRIETPFFGQQARYIKVSASQYGKLPDWHPGAGGDSIIFMDEVEVE